MGLNIGYLTSNKKQDELYSPYYAIDPLMKFISKDKVIWMPCDEEWSAFYNKFTEGGYRVIRSSIQEGQDFFEYEPENWDILVTNPPFSLKDKFLERAYSFNKPFALLLPLNSLQGKTRYKYFSQGIQLLSFDARISFHDMKHLDEPIKGSPFASAYFCRDLLPRDLIVEKLEIYNRPLKIE